VRVPSSEERDPRRQLLAVEPPPSVLPSADPGLGVGREPLRQPALRRPRPRRGPRALAPTQGQPVTGTVGVSARGPSPRAMRWQEVERAPAARRVPTLLLTTVDGRAGNPGAPLLGDVERQAPFGRYQAPA